MATRSVAVAIVDVVYLDIYLFYVYACSGGNNNKWSKNFDERPHRSELVTPATGESNLEPRFRRDALSPADKSAAPCCCRRLLLTQSNAFQWGSTTPKISPCPGEIRDPTYYMVHWPTRVHKPNGNSIGSSVFVGFTVVSNRQTDHATSVV